MPKFFIPMAETSEQAERVYEATRRHISAPAQHSKIYALSWQHNGQAMTCRVGEPLPSYYRTGDDVVVAIFDAGNLYMICTAERGVLRGSPVLAGKDIQSHATYFDPSETIN
jgi:hypothetical protein